MLLHRPLHRGTRGHRGGNDGEAINVHHDHHRSQSTWQQSQYEDEKHDITRRTSERTCQAKRTLGRPFGPLRSLRLSVLPEIHYPVLSWTRPLSTLIGQAHSRAAEYRENHDAVTENESRDVFASPFPDLCRKWDLPKGRTDAIPLMTSQLNRP